MKEFSVVMTEAGLQLRMYAVGKISDSDRNWLLGLTSALGAKPNCFECGRGIEVGRRGYLSERDGHAVVRHDRCA